MRNQIRLLTMMLAVSITCGALAGSDDVKSLSTDELSALLDGRGMGMARPAELNGYPGPAHVLELASQLELDTGQLAGTQEIFARMQRTAKTDGAALIQAERGLDALYAAKTATRGNVQAQLAKIEKIRAHLRGVHLNAHLEESTLLTPHQRMRYAELRGYAVNAHAGH